MKNKLIIGIAVFLLVLTSYAYGFGISSTYVENNNLIMSPGEQETLRFQLQNMVGDENARIEVKIIEGNEISKFRDVEGTEIYTLDVGEKKYIYLDINLPETAQIGDSYKIQITFTSMPLETTTGAMGLKTAINKEYTISVGEPQPEPVAQPKAEEESSAVTYILIALVILIALIILLILRKRKSE